MPIRVELRPLYPPNWPEISAKAAAAAMSTGRPLLGTV
jgi:hypothetical protein